MLRIFQNSNNLVFERFWTETVKKDKLKASFIYSFEDSNSDIGAARVQVNGYAILNKTPVEDEKSESWSFDELYILDNKVEFKEGMQISTSDIPEGDYPGDEHPGNQAEDQEK